MRPGIQRASFRLVSAIAVAVAGMLTLSGCVGAESVETKAVSGRTANTLSSTDLVDPDGTAVTVGGDVGSDIEAAARRAASWTSYELQLSEIQRDGPRTLYVSGSIDSASGNLHLSLMRQTSEPGEDFVELEALRVEDGHYLRGPRTADVGGEDPDQWYQVDEAVFAREAGMPDDPLNRTLVHLVEIGDPVEVATGRWVVDMNRLDAQMEGRDEPDSDRPVSPEDLAVIEVLVATESEVRFTLTAIDTDVGERALEVQLKPIRAAYKSPDDFVVLEVDASRVVRTVPEIDPRIMVVPDDEGVVFTVGRYLSDENFRLSFEENGRVVLVTDSSIHATAKDFTAWTVPPTAIDERVDWLVDSTLIGHPEANLQFGDAEGAGHSISFGTGFVLNVHGPVEAGGLMDSQIERRRLFFDLFDRLSDVAAVQSVALTGPEPYVPEAMIVTPRSPAGPVNAEWPLDVSPANLVVPGEQRFCLLGDDAAAVWAAMGELSVSDMVVEVDGAAWNILIYPGSPGYLTNRYLCPDR